ncbi:hypothetical protein, partial [Planotetraspora kaengkrachanensis]|uniref:hypothetical protein n=1 Tax=Planotetraspora kaengkrachanensis TaxID=575193 RepID=UPI0031EDD272
HIRRIEITSSRTIRPPPRPTPHPRHPLTRIRRPPHRLNNLEQHSTPEAKKFELAYESFHDDEYQATNTDG